MNSTFIVNSLADTQNLAKNFAKELAKNPHAIILMYGEMGVGKTTFSRFLLKSLNHTINPSSPTFSIINQYTNNIYHIDLYRIENPDNFMHLGLEEIFSSDDKGRPNNIVIIEWAENLPPEYMKSLILNDKETVQSYVYKILIKALDDEKREITIETHNEVQNAI